VLPADHSPRGVLLRVTCVIMISKHQQQRGLAPSEAAAQQELEFGVG